MKYLGILLIFANTIFAQPPEMEYNKGYGTDQGEHVHEIRQTNDGGYIGIGQTDETIEDRYDILVVKTDADGEFQWQKIIGTKGEFDIGICVNETDGGYLIGGGLFEGNQKRYMAKLDYKGAIVWQKTYETKRNGMIRGIEVLDNGEIVTTGYKNCALPGFVFIADNSDGFIMKTDANGNTIWEKKISVAQGAKVRQELDKSGFVICSTTWMNDPDNPQDMYLLKTDNQGNETNTVMILM
jgi:hypothetical protein